MLELKNVTKSYGAKTALKNVSISAPAGKIIGLLGPNGSGKTTMIKILTGLINDYKGEALIDGNAPGVKTCAYVSYLPDRVVMPGWLTVKDAVKLYWNFYKDFDMPRAEGMLGSMLIDLNKRIKTLSKGMIEKLQLALVMSRRAKLYVLDEPIAAVDPAAREFILRTIIGNFGGDSSVLLSTHLISDVESILDHAVFIKDGEVILSEEAETIREREGKSIDQLFREVFKC
jgi:ABC-2 type transport system ATP-binding protein